jgi:hypothetical protein
MPPRAERFALARHVFPFSVRLQRPSWLKEFVRALQTSITRKEESSTGSNE